MACKGKSPPKGNVKSEFKSPSKNKTDENVSNINRQMIYRCLDFNTTPRDSIQGQAPLFGPEFISTPACQNLNAPVCDASAISVDQSYTSILNSTQIATGVKKKVKPRFTHTRPDNVDNTKLPRYPPKHKKDSKKEEEILQAEMDLLFSQNLQMCYLESRARKSLEIRNKKNLERIHKIWTAIQFLLLEDNRLSREIASIQYARKQLEFYNGQMNEIEPVLNDITVLMEQYQEISCGADSIRHKLHIPHVSITSEDEVLDLVIQTEKLVDGMLGTLCTEQSSLPEAAGLLRKIQAMLGDMSKEIDRCSQLLLTADKLAVAESSQKIAVHQLQTL